MPLVSHDWSTRSRDQPLNGRVLVSRLLVRNEANCFCRMRSAEEHYNSGMAPAQRLSMLSDGDLQLELTSVEPHPVHKCQTHFFRMLNGRSGKELGPINLRVGGGVHIERYAGHIGYFVEPEHRGHAYAARALRLLTDVAHDLGLNPIWITCDPDTIPSRRACERAGAEFIEIVDVPADCTIHQNGHSTKCRYRLPSSG
jgi:predicted acetyltransferase